MTALDDRIAALHVRMVRAEDAGHQGECDWYRFEIRRLEDAAAVESARAHRRQLSRDYAAACWGGDTDAAAVIQAEIDRLERGQQ